MTNEKLADWKRSDFFDGMTVFPREMWKAEFCQNGRHLTRKTHCINGVYRRVISTAFIVPHLSLSEISYRQTPYGGRDSEICKRACPIINSQ
jgi:hypothetical protein